MLLCSDGINHLILFRMIKHKQTAALKVTDKYTHFFHCRQQTKSQLQPFFLYLARTSLAIYVFSNDTTAPFRALYQTVFRYTNPLHIIEQNKSYN